MKTSKLPRRYLKQTPLGQEVRYDHEECGDTRGRLYVKRVVGGWLWHCHNCNAHGRSHHKASPRETMMMLGEGKRQNEGRGGKVNRAGVWLPNDLTNDLPAEARKWLDKYGITEDELAKFRIRYSNTLNRLILPVYSQSDNEVMYWQGRNLGKITRDNPKYLNMKAPGRDVFFHIQPEHIVQVVVEDILSAIKVGRVAGAIALLGSYMPDSIVPLLKGKRVVVWLDPDKLYDSVQYAKKLVTVWGISAKALIEAKDPKEYSTDEIHRRIWRYLEN